MYRQQTANRLLSSGRGHATSGRLQAVRLDSQITPTSVREIHALLDSLGTPHVRIFVSNGLDEWRTA